MFRSARFSALAGTLPLAALLLVLLAVPTVVRAQDNAQPADDQDPASLLEDFVHWTLAGRPEFAAAYAKALLDRGLTDAELVMVLEEGKTSQDRFNRALDIALQREDLKELAGQLSKRVRVGRLDMARDPERIKSAIANLSGNAREKRIATEQLRAAGEYAVPELLRQIMTGQDESIKLACQRIIRDIGRVAVYPLTVALFSVDPATQRVISDLLSEIGYGGACPALLELSRDEQAPDVVREAAGRAFRACGGVDGSLSVQYSNLGRQYFNEVDALLAYPNDPTNNVWSFDPHVGLVPTPVPTIIFNEVMAMKNASKALQEDQSNAAALSLMVAANLKRENELPKDAVDPIYGDAAFSPQFYATVFGTQTCQDVLAMALDANDTALVRDAITALQQTTGGSNLFGKAGARQPLLEALQYPSRRVQYDAALTLARALPRENFANQVAVVPLLASAIRAGTDSYALAIVDDEEERRTQVARLEKLGYTVVGQGADVTQLQADIGLAPAIDLVLIQRARPAVVADVISQLNSNPKTAGAPVLVVAEPSAMTQLQRQFASNPRVKVGSKAADDEGFSLAMNELIERAGGGRITEAEAEVYAVESMSALRDIAVSNSPVFTIADAEPALLDALDSRSGGARLLVADILALINSPASQQALFDAALAAPSDDEKVELLNRVADSVKRHGNKAETRHVDGIVELIGGTPGPVAESAARVNGALNLPTSDAIKLLP